jgi:hypothetical protein
MHDESAAEAALDSLASYARNTGVDEATRRSRGGPHPGSATTTAERRRLRQDRSSMDERERCTTASASTGPASDRWPDDLRQRDPLTPRRFLDLGGELADPRRHDSFTIADESR